MEYTEYLVQMLLYVWVAVGNGYGSSRTNTRRFSNLMRQMGSAITYFDDVNDGAYFKINEAGVYTIDYTDQCSRSFQSCYYS